MSFPSWPGGSAGEGHPFPPQGCLPLRSQWHGEAGPSPDPAEPPPLHSSVLPQTTTRSTECGEDNVRTGKIQLQVYRSVTCLCNGNTPFSACPAEREPRSHPPEHRLRQQSGEGAPEGRVEQRRGTEGPVMNLSQVLESGLFSVCSFLMIS